MKNENAKDTEAKTPGILYAAAYRTHHMIKEFSRALVLYKAIIAAYPHSKEAGYSRTQIRAIEGKVYPRYVRSEAQPDKATSVSDPSHS